MVINMNLPHNEFKNNNFFIFKIIMYKLQYLLVPMIIKLASSQQCKPFEYNGNLPYNKQGLIADYNSENIKQTNGLLDLHLTKSLGGTRLSIAESLHYGTIEAKFKISPGTNVVSSFILMAENEDEIDFEFVQNTLNKTNVIQTNYFYKGIPIFDKNAKMFKTEKPLANFYHTYSIHWTPNFYEWRFNNYTLRRLLKNETKDYPDSPSKIQFGIWQANSSNWAGPGINWDSTPFVLSIKSIKVLCNNISSTISSIVSQTVSSTISPTVSTTVSSTVPSTTSSTVPSTEVSSTEVSSSVYSSVPSTGSRNNQIKFEPYSLILNLIFPLLIINLM
jgi:beta-glucanase (GH16 family)